MPWTPETILLLVVAVPLFYAGAIMLTLTIQLRYRYFLNATGAWILVGTEKLILTAGIALQSVVLVNISTYLFIPIGGFILLKADYLTHDRVDPKKLLVYCGLVMVFFAFSLDPGSIVADSYQSGAPTYFYSLPRLLAFNMMALFPIVWYFGVMVRLYRRSPPHLKRASGLYLLGLVFVGIISLIFSFVRITFRVLPAIDSLMVAIGGVIIVLAVRRDPQVLFVLPFTVHRLTVLETTAGLAIFTHTWERTSREDHDLYAGMLQGVNLIIRESLNKGNFKEIQLDEATMIAHRCAGTSIACVLVTTNATRTLREALEMFSGMFLARFKDALANPSKVSAFQDAAALVPTCFPFVPVPPKPKPFSLEAPSSG